SFSGSSGSRCAHTWAFGGRHHSGRTLFPTFTKSISIAVRGILPATAFSGILLTGANSDGISFPHVPRPIERCITQNMADEALLGRGQTVELMSDIRRRRRRHQASIA